MKNINKMLLVVAGLTSSQTSIYFEEQPVNSKELESLLTPLNQSAEKKNNKVEDNSLADLLKMLGANENEQLTTQESEDSSKSSKTQILMNVVGVLIAAMPVIQIILSLKGSGNNPAAYTNNQKQLSPNVISALRSLDSFCSRVSMYSEGTGLSRDAKIKKLESLVKSAIVNDEDTLKQALAYLKLMKEISEKDINFLAEELMKEDGDLSDKIFNEEMLNYIKDWTNEATQKQINEFNEKLYSKGSFTRTAEGIYVSKLATPFKWSWTKTKKAARYVANHDLVNKVAGHTTSYGIDEDDIKNHQMVKVLNLLKEKVRRDTHGWAQYLANK